jgi:hypothetical protein
MLQMEQWHGENHIQIRINMMSCNKSRRNTFLQEFKHPMIQLNPLSTILVICHTDNTVDKSELREEHLAQVGTFQSKFKETVRINWKI